MSTPNSSELAQTAKLILTSLTSSRRIGRRIKSAQSPDTLAAQGPGQLPRWLGLPRQLLACQLRKASSQPALLTL